MNTKVTELKDVAVQTSIQSFQSEQKSELNSTVPLSTVGRRETVQFQSPTVENFMAEMHNEVHQFLMDEGIEDCMSSTTSIMPELQATSSNESENTTRPNSTILKGTQSDLVTRSDLILAINSVLTTDSDEVEKKSLSPPRSERYNLKLHKSRTVLPYRKRRAKSSKPVVNDVPETDESSDGEQFAAPPRKKLKTRKDTLCNITELKKDMHEVVLAKPKRGRKRKHTRSRSRGGNHSDPESDERHKRCPHKKPRRIPRRKYTKRNTKVVKQKPDIPEPVDSDSDVECSTELISNNPFLNFLREYRAQHTEMLPKEITVKGAKAWRKLDSNKKVKYIPQKGLQPANVRKKKYTRRVIVVNNNPYLNFLQDYRCEHDHLDNRQQLLKGAAAWRKLNTRQRSKYQPKTYSEKWRKYADRLKAKQEQPKEKFFKPAMDENTDASDESEEKIELKSKRTRSRVRKLSKAVSVESKNSEPHIRLKSKGTRSRVRKLAGKKGYVCKKNKKQIGLKSKRTRSRLRTPVDGISGESQKSEQQIEVKSKNTRCRISKPKRPYTCCKPRSGNPYMNFLREYRVKHRHLKATDQVRAGAAAWRKLSDRERSLYKNTCLNPFEATVSLSNISITSEAEELAPTDLPPTLPITNAADATPTPSDWFEAAQALQKNTAVQPITSKQEEPSKRGYPYCFGFMSLFFGK